MRVVRLEGILCIQTLLCISVFLSPFATAQTEPSLIEDNPDSLALVERAVTPDGYFSQACFTCVGQSCIPSMRGLIWEADCKVYSAKYLVGFQSESASQQSRAIEQVDVADFINSVIVENERSDSIELSEAHSTYLSSGSGLERYTRDYDGDGYPDFVEYAVGSDWLNMNRTPVDINGNGTMDVFELGYDQYTSDADADGFPDFIEQIVSASGRGYSSKSASSSDSPIPFVEGSWTEDNDGDGYLDLVEHVFGSDDTNKNKTPVDMDGDGVIDIDGSGTQDAINNGHYTDDTDGDGYSDFVEYIVASDDRDSTKTPIDRDGNGEVIEVGGTWNDDSDGDGYIDIVEQSVGSDWQNGNKTPIDMDGDGSIDVLGIEVLYIYDYDDDGYPDYIEQTAGSDWKNKDKTPLDKDGDGTLDAIETVNPYIADMDEDTYSDFLEGITGSDPNNPESTPLDKDGDGTADVVAVLPDPVKEVLQIGDNRIFVQPISLEGDADVQWTVHTEPSLAQEAEWGCDETCVYLYQYYQLDISGDENFDSYQVLYTGHDLSFRVGGLPDGSWYFRLRPVYLCYSSDSTSPNRNLFVCSANYLAAENNYYDGLNRVDVGAEYAVANQVVLISEVGGETVAEALDSAERSVDDAVHVAREAQRDGAITLANTYKSAGFINTGDTLESVCSAQTPGQGELDLIRCTEALAVSPIFATQEAYAKQFPQADRDSDGFANAGEVLLHAGSAGGEVLTTLQAPVDFNGDGRFDQADIFTAIANPAAIIGMIVDVPGTVALIPVDFLMSLIPSEQVGGVEDNDCDDYPNALESALGTDPNDSESPGLSITGGPVTTGLRSNCRSFNN